MIVGMYYCKYLLYSRVYRDGETQQTETRTEERLGREDGRREWGRKPKEVFSSRSRIAHAYTCTITRTSVVHARKLTNLHNDRSRSRGELQCKCRLFAVSACRSFIF